MAGDPLLKVRDETLLTLRQHVAAGETVALLDYPNHFNAGDLLIYRGTTEYVRKIGAHIGYVCATHTYDRDVLEQLVPTGPILFNGGGNFGDRWTAYQKFRERVIRDLPHRRIVQLPQTMEFRSTTELARVQRIYSEHPDLTLMLRDQAGFDQATSLFPDNRVVYCPDLAFGVGSIEPPAVPSRDIIVLKRADGESIHEDHTVFASKEIADWHVSLADNMKWWPATLLTSIAHRFKPLRYRRQPKVYRMFEWQTDMIIDAATGILARGRVVVTDRLHAGILAVLMGKPVVMIDNANRKVSKLYEEILFQFPETYLVENFTDAHRVAEEIAYRTRNCQK